MHRLFRNLLSGVAVCLAGVSVAASFADDVEQQEAAAKIARLQELVARQQERLSELNAQVAAQAQQDAEAARISLLRDQIRQILSEQEFHESLMPSVMQAGYDKGFFIRSSDEEFLMKVNGRAQFRFTHYGTRARNRYTLPRLERDDRTGFDVQRLRLGVSGHAYSKDLTYLLEFRGDSSNSYDVVMQYGWVNYRFADELQFRAGLFKIAGTRAQMHSSGNLQFVDRSMTDAVFSLDRGLGVRFWGQVLNRRLDYYLDVVNAFGGPNTRTITTDDARELDNNPAIVLHGIWHVLGDEPGDLMKSESDVTFHENPALDLGAHYAFDADEGDRRTLRIPFRRPGRMPGAYGLTTSNGMQVHQIGVDSAFQWRGFSATFEYLWRFLDPRRAGRTPFTPYWLLTGDGTTDDYHGGYLQVGYFLPIPGLEKKLEAVARVGGVSSIGPGSEGSWEYAGGVNYYFQRHGAKLQADVTKIYEAPITSPTSSLAEVNDDALVFRVQLQVAF